MDSNRRLPLYRSRVFIAGVALVALGLGNYVAANVKVNQYETILSEVALRLHAPHPPLLHDGRGSARSEAQERWEIGRAKLDFYHVVLSAGRLMLSIGLICLAIALIRLRTPGSRWYLSSS